MGLQLSSTEEVARGRMAMRLEDFDGQLFLLEPPKNLAEPHLPNAAADRRDSTFRRLLGVSDVLATIAALVATATFTSTEQVYGAMFAAVLVVIPLGKLAGLYDRDAHVLNHTTLDEVPRLTSMALTIAVCAFVARDLSVTGTTDIGAEQLLFLWASLTVLFCAGRFVARIVARMTTPVERLLVVGGDAETETLRRKLELEPSIRATIVGRVPIAYNDLPGGQSKVLGEAADLRRVIEAFDIDRLVVIPGNRHPDEVSDVVRAVKSVGVKISLMPQLFDAIGFSVESDEVGGVQMMGVRDFRMTASSSAIKRMTDIAGAALILLLASPVMIATAIAIKLDSRGPVFFRQLRIGRGGEQFEILKFRSMRNGADRELAEVAELNETAGLFKAAGDPRITRVGRFIRKASIDELPQLINVLRGEMSLVGPRPLVPHEDVAITGWYRRRSQLTPGITGAWQLYGPVRMPLNEMVKIDYLYVANWSWWSDVKILLRTSEHVLARRGL